MGDGRCLEYEGCTEPRVRRKKAKRPERRTALIARELKRYNIPIVALSETRFADEGDLTEREAGYTFF